MYETHISKNYRSKSYTPTKVQTIVKPRRKIIPKHDPVEEKLDDILFRMEQALEI